MNIVAATFRVACIAGSGVVFLYTLTFFDICQPIRVWRVLLRIAVGISRTCFLMCFRMRPQWPLGGEVARKAIKLASLLNHLRG
jgi:hypothetical protein